MTIIITISIVIVILFVGLVCKARPFHHEIESRSNASAALKPSLLVIDQKNSNNDPAFIVRLLELGHLKEDYPTIRFFFLQKGQVQFNLQLRNR